jgi:hypothetical protein
MDTFDQDRHIPRREGDEHGSDFVPTLTRRPRQSQLIVGTQWTDQNVFNVFLNEQIAILFPVSHLQEAPFRATAFKRHNKLDPAGFGKIHAEHERSADETPLTPPEGPELDASSGERIQRRPTAIAVNPFQKISILLILPFTSFAINLTILYSYFHIGRKYRDSSWLRREISWRSIDKIFRRA